MVYICLPHCFFNEMNLRTRYSIRLLKKIKHLRKNVMKETELKLKNTSIANHSYFRSIVHFMALICKLKCIDVNFHPYFNLYHLYNGKFEIPTVVIKASHNFKKIHLQTCLLSFALSLHFPPLKAIKHKQ